MIQNKPNAYGLLAGLIVLLLGVIATCTSCAATMKLDGKPRNAPQQMRSTYRVITWCVNDVAFPTIALDRKGGSGVMADKHHILTALHVVHCDEGNAAVYVISSTGERFDAIVQRTWDKKDIAQLYIHFELAGKAAQLGPMPKPGDGICTQIANPDFGAACGEVDHIDRAYPQGDIVHTADTRHGHSGGGAYDQQGRLIGIVTELVPCASAPSFSCGGRVSSLQGLGL